MKPTRHLRSCAKSATPFDKETDQGMTDEGATFQKITDEHGTRYKCSVCPNELNYSSDRRFNMKRHCERHHTTIKPRNCCNIAFQTRGDYNTHLVMKHKKKIRWFSEEDKMRKMTSRIKLQTEKLSKRIKKRISNYEFSSRNQRYNQQIDEHEASESTKRISVSNVSHENTETANSYEFEQEKKEASEPSTQQRGILVEKELEDQENIPNGINASQRRDNAEISKILHTLKLPPKKYILNKFQSEDEQSEDRKPLCDIRNKDCKITKIERFKNININVIMKKNILQAESKSPTSSRANKENVKSECQNDNIQVNFQKDISLNSLTRQQLQFLNLIDFNNVSFDATITEATISYDGAYNKK